MSGIELNLLIVFGVVASLALLFLAGWTRDYRQNRRRARLLKARFGN